MAPPEDDRKVNGSKVVVPLMEIFGLSRGLALTAILSISLLILLAVFWFFHSAPPRTLIITSGGPGSAFQTNAQKYAVILARNGVTLRVLPSEGSLENLHRLDDPKFHVEVGFVQGGITNNPANNKLVSLGSIMYEPLLVLYRGAPVSLLSNLNGKRLAIGPVGSGTRALALTLLQLNGIEPGGATALVDLDSGEAAKALLDGSVDAVFLMGESAPTPLIRQLLLAPGIQLLDFVQADGYSRRISYLNKLVLPKGSIDFGKNIPSHDVFLIGPTVELLARPDLHPALSDLLLAAAQEVHNPPSLFRLRDEFPANIEHDFPISSDAKRYYKSGKKFPYGTIHSFWLASLLDRILVVFVPLIVVLIPVLRIFPSLFTMRLKLSILRWYRALLLLERELAENLAENLTPRNGNH